MVKLISIVTPIYNEEENIEELYKQLNKFFKIEKKYNFEIIAVEHGSIDTSFEKLLKLHKKDKRLKILQLSKNFGNADAGIAAGLVFAKGDAAVIMMADLQESPEIISKFLRKWEEGFEIVYGIIKKRADSTYTRKFFSLAYYKILNRMTNNLFPPNVADFRLIDKKVYLAVNNMPERNKFLRGMVIWTGFKQTGIPFNRAPRFGGSPKADFKTALNVAKNGIFSFSYLPLRVITLLGVLVSLLSFLMIIVQLVLLAIYGKVSPGQTTVVILISFFFGMLFLILGLIGEYLSRIYDEVKGRPTYIVKNKIGIN